MKKFLIVGLGVLLSACGGLTSRTAPDELAVIEGPSLAIPPNYDLRPPRTGENRTAEQRRQARDILLSSEGVQVESQSPDTWLIEAAGGSARNPNIRAQLEKEQQKQVEKEEKRAEKGWFGRVFSDNEDEITVE